MSTLMTLVDRCYQLQEQLGEGGMGTVFRAVHLLNRQPVALKLIAMTPAAEGSSMPSSQASYSEAGLELRLALAREFQTLASLHHPNVIRVQSYGFDDRRGSYFTMELLENAESILKTEASTTEDKALLIAQVLRALSYIHHRGVIHRDVKPGNILVVGGEVKLLDFGIASKKAEHADLAGTLEYMAPELLRGAAPSVQSDLYAVGLILHQLLTGYVPVTAQSMRHSQSHIAAADPQDGSRTMGLNSSAAIAEVTPPQPAEVPLSFTQALDRLDLDGSSDVAQNAELVVGISGPLGDVITKLIRTDPADRYQDADVALRELSAALGIHIPVETAETRESVLRANVLIGRDSELAILRNRLQHSKDGRGGALVLGGESGVGKSRLIAELRTLALVHGFWGAEGQSVTEGGAYYQEWLPFFRALCLRVDLSDSEAAVLKPMVSDIEEILFRSIPDAPPVKPEEVQPRLLATLRGLISRLSKPVLLILEDLHWARTESLALLNELSQQVEALPMMLVGTYRTDESPDLPARLPRMTSLVLNRLNMQQIAQLSESMLGELGRQPELLSYLARQTEGNVFFLIEIVRALAESAGELRRIGQGELPESVLTEGIGQIVERRIERIPVAYRPLMQFAATLGRRLDLKVLAHMFPAAPLSSLLIQCANAMVIESQGADWRFAHDKLREAILRQIPQDARCALHREVAEGIEAVYSGEQRNKLSSLLAYHFAKAGLPERSLRYYLSAADDAMRLCLYAEARVCISGALEALTQLDDTPDHRRLRFDLLLRQIQTSLLTDKLDVQIERTRVAQSVLDSLTAPEGAQREDRLRQARLHYNLGRAYHYAGQPAEAIKRYQLVLPVAQEYGDQELLVLPAFVTGIALCMQGQSAKGCALLSKAVGPMERMGNTFEWLRAVLFHSLTLGHTGKYREAQEQMQRALVQAERIGQPSVLAMCRLMLGGLHRAGSDWQQAAEHAQKTVEYASQSGDKVYLYAGWSLQAWALAYLGQHGAADEYREKSLAIAREMGGRMIMSDWFEAADGERAALAEQWELAVSRAQAVIDKSRPAGLVISHGIAERVWGYVLGRLGASDAELAAHFEESIRVFRVGENALDIAHSELWWGRVLCERGERDRASHHLLAAKEQYERSHAQVALRAAESLLMHGTMPATL